MRVIINTVCLKNEDPADFIPLFSKLGWKEIEFHMNHFLEQKHDPKRIFSLLTKNKIKVHAMSGGWCDFFNEDNSKTMVSIKKQVNICKIMGCNILRLFLGIRKPSQYKSLKKTLICNLSKLSKSYPGMIFIFETHDGVSLDSRQMHDLFSALSAEYPNLMINYDPANIEKEHPGKALAFLKLNYPFIGHCHIKGLRSHEGQQIKDFYCSYGEGLFSYINIFKYLRKAKYRGYLSLEFEGHGCPFVEISRSLGILKRDIKRYS
ncbi:sugar phosphate isomerase/epimerase [Candidatus Woesearchaeota archaeon]|nr:sugar phosphate isomerase/epimerase [Candidatus Woesearchaeota archaeon]